MSQQTVLIPNSRRVDFTSKVNGRRYSLSVSLPLEPPPAKGYRALYVLDGYAYFGSATEAVRVNGNAPQTVVVGLGYPDDSDYIDTVLKQHGRLPPHMAAIPPVWAAITLGRFYDLSLPVSDEWLVGRQIPWLTSKDTGGLGDFLKTIEIDVKPRVTDIAPIDDSNQAIFGHSLGGLATLHALFIEPNAFRTFIVASPSIDWDQRIVLADEKNFSAAVENGTARPRVLVAVGADEDVMPTPGPGVDVKAMKAAWKSRMVEDARELTLRLQALKGTSPYEVEDFIAFEKQGHGIAPWPALGRGISFAFPRPA